MQLLVFFILLSENKSCITIDVHGRLAQLVRASRLHREGLRFESVVAYHKKRASKDVLFLWLEDWDLNRSGSVSDSERRAGHSPSDPLEGVT